MKFGAYRQQVAPGVMSPPALKAPADVNAYGEAEGAGYGALAAALGQASKVVMQQRDDEDAAALTKARNEIMTNLTQQLYGKDGLFETGIGKRAEGLTGRVVDAVHKTTARVASRLNGRVAYALKGNLSENLQNFQRIAASKELSEKEQMVQGDFQSALANNATLAGLNYDNAAMVQAQMKENDRFVMAWGLRQGLTGEQIEALRRDATTKTAQAAANAAMQADDPQTARAILQAYREGMDPAVYWSIAGKIQEKDAQNTMATDVRQVMERHRVENADGSVVYDMDAVLKEIQSGKKRVKRHEKGGAGSYSGDAAIDQEIADAAAEFGVEPRLLAALAQVESSFGQEEVSEAGALGVMQLMPDTAAALGVNARDRRDNIRGGAKYLRQMLDLFGGDVDLAVAAYNAGPQAVKDAHGVPPYQETRNHVRKVKEAYEALEKKGGGIDMNRTYYEVKPGKEGEVEGLTGSTWQKLNTLAALYKERFGGEEDYEPFYVTAGKADGGHSEGSDHYKGLAFDIAMDSLARHRERLEWLEETAPKIGLTPLNEYEGYGYTGFKTGDNFHFSDNGGEISIGAGGEREEEAPYTQDEIDARVKYAWALYAEQDRLNGIRQKQAYEGIMGQVDAAGSYADAALVIGGSGLPLDLKERALGLARSKFGITRTQADGRTGGGRGAGGRGDSLQKDVVSLQKFAAKLEAGERVQAADLVTVHNAKLALQEAGLFDDGELGSLENNEAFLSKITGDIERDGWPATYRSLVERGLDPMVAAALMSNTHPALLPYYPPPEDDADGEVAGSDDDDNDVYTMAD